MPVTDTSQWNFGRMFGFLTKQYIGHLTKRLEHTPVERYYFPLFLIGTNSGKISQQQLADKLLTDKVCLVRILDSLTDEGFVERRVNPKDRRQHLLYITPKGEPWVREIEIALLETDELFLNLFPEDQRPVFRAALQHLITATKDLPVEQVELYYNRVKDEKND